MLDAALKLVATSGPSGVSVMAIAERLGAPSGSMYHRFPSRDHLLAALWVRTVEHFQAGYLQALAAEDPREGALGAAGYTFDWSRDNLEQAQLLLIFRSRDLTLGEWPPELKDKAQELRSQLERGLRRWARRAGLPLERGTFAVIDLPYAAVRRSIQSGRRPRPSLRLLLLEAVSGVIDAHLE